MPKFTLYLASACMLALTGCASELPETNRQFVLVQFDPAIETLATVGEKADGRCADYRRQAEYMKTTDGEFGGLSRALFKCVPSPS